MENYFSAYKVDSIEHIDDVEGLLITAIPLAANSSKPKITRILLPRSIKNLMGRLRRISADELRKYKNTIQGAAPEFYYAALRKIP